ncbi:glycine N-acyltransferase-like isoform X1, partial [Clarias magur]
MKVLSEEELQEAEEELKHYFPKSRQVYGYVFLINRVKTEPTDVLVDRWPDFTVLLIRPQRKERTDLFKDISIFTKDETSLKDIMISTDIFDWNQYLSLSIDLCHKEMIKSVALSRGVQELKNHVCQQLTLQDASNLKPERLPLQMSSLSESHVALVNSMWKFGKDEFSEHFIRDMIKNYPSCCVLDSECQPVSWILTYASCSVGMLYTMPEHRRKGYAKAVVTVLARKLRSEGYPVYCLIEEENQAYGYVFIINRVVARPVDVLVDQWPDFNTLLIRPQRQEKADHFKDMCIFTKDETSLMSILIRVDIFDWKQFLSLSGDLCHKEMMNSVALNRGVPDIKNYEYHLFTLQDASNLKSE